MVVETDILPDHGLHKAFFTADHRSDRRILHQLQAGHIRDGPLLLLVGFVDIPGVIALRPVLKDHQGVARPARSDHLPLLPAVIQGNDLPLPVKPQVIEFGAKAGEKTAAAGLTAENHPRPFFFLRLLQTGQSERQHAFGRHVLRQKQPFLSVYDRLNQAAAVKSQLVCHKQHAGSIPRPARACRFQSLSHSLIPCLNPPFCPLHHLRANLPQLCKLPVRIPVDLPDGGPGQNVVELVQQQQLPSLLQLLSRVGESLIRQSCHHTEQFRIHQQELALPVVLLNPGHGGVGAPMEFQIQLPAPPGHLLPLQIVLQNMEKLVHTGDPDRRAIPSEISRPRFQALLLLQHLPGGSSPSVPEAEAGQHVPAQILVPVALPGPHDLIGVHPAVVGGLKGLAAAHLGIFFVVAGGDKIGQHLAAVQSPPVKGIVWNLVVLVPSQLCGHEIFDPRLS